MLEVLATLRVQAAALCTVHTGPPVGDVIDAAWRPVWSQHEPPRRTLPASQSAACSMSLALAAKRAAEVATNTTYDLVWAMRCGLCRAALAVAHRCPRLPTDASPASFNTPALLEGL